MSDTHRKIKDDYGPDADVDWGDVSRVAARSTGQKIVRFSGELVEQMGDEWSPAVQVRLRPLGDGTYELESRLVGIRLVGISADGALTGV